MINTFLLNDFYTITSVEKPTENKLLVNIQIDPAHIIFKGHFEGMPVVPGVCQTQIIKEILQQETGKNFILTNGSNIKFTGMIIPTTHANIKLELSYSATEDQYTVDAQLFFENTIFTKFKGTFTAN